MRITVRVVKNHLESLMKQLDFQSYGSLVRYLINRELARLEKKMHYRCYSCDFGFERPGSVEKQKCPKCGKNDSIEQDEEYDENPNFDPGDEDDDDEWV